jgi:hypothetical protein
MNLSDYAENKIFDALLRAQALGVPATWYLALGTNLRSDSGAPTEPVGNGYARLAVVPSLANFSGTQAPGSTTASTGTDGTGENNIDLIFPTSTGAWGDIKSVWFMDAAAAGNCWLSIDNAQIISVSGAGFTLKFAAGQLSFQVDN